MKGWSQAGSRRTSRGLVREVLPQGEGRAGGVGQDGEPAHAGHGLVGDPVYGGRLKLPAGASSTLKEILRDFPRQALHARKLAFVHPGSGETASFRAPLPDDLLMLLDYLRDDSETMR